MNYHTPSDANKIKRSRLSTRIFIIYGSLVTPTCLETLSPKDLLIARPWRSEKGLIYFGLAARLSEDQPVGHVHHERHESFLHFSLFSFFMPQQMVCGLVRDKSVPSFFYQLNKKSCTLSCKNSSWISNIGADNFFWCNTNSNKSRSTASYIDIWVC